MYRVLLLLLLLSCTSIQEKNLETPVAILRSGGESGAAFIVGEQGGQLYLLTAAHVIEDATDITLQFQGANQQKGRVVNSDSDLDIAVISCLRPTGFLPDSYSISTNPIKDDQGVVIIGHPLGNDWDINKINLIKESAFGIVPGRFTVYPTGIGPGSSGGPVLDANGQLLGLVTEVDQVKTVCVGVDVLLRACEKWTVPVQDHFSSSPDPEPSLSEASAIGSLADSSVGTMVLIPGGSFNMGSNEGEDDEKPIHRVSLTAFYLGVYEVTAEEFEAFVLASGYRTDAEKVGDSYIWADGKWEKKDGVYWKHDAKGDLRPRSEYRHPVIHVSWNDAQAYCKWLSEQSGFSYRLPTEAEWEYAAGNGSAHTRYSWGNGDPSGKNGGNVADESKSPTGQSWATKFTGYDDGYWFTAPVGQYNPNTVGLYDMTGNVWEWCSDYYGDYLPGAQTNPQGPAKGSYRVLRGGSWNLHAVGCRVANRYYYDPSYRFSNLGFRLARSF